jgi:HSP20 family protein
MKGRRPLPEPEWFRSQVEAVARHFFTSHRSAGDGGFDPAVDVLEGEDALVVEMELPGVREEGLSVSLQSGRLVVEGRKGGGDPPASARFLLLERQFGAFNKSVEIPTPVNPARASVVLDQGVLTVRFPRVHDQRSPRVDLVVTRPGAARTGEGRRDR